MLTKVKAHPLERLNNFFSKGPSYFHSAEDFIHVVGDSVSMTQAFNNNEGSEMEFFSRMASGAAGGKARGTWTLVIGECENPPLVAC